MGGTRRCMCAGNAGVSEFCQLDLLMTRCVKTCHHKEVQYSIQVKQLTLRTQVVKTA